MKNKYALLIHGPYSEQWLCKIKNDILNFKYGFEKIVLVTYSKDYDKYLSLVSDLNFPDCKIVVVKDLINPGFFNINRQILTVNAGLNELDNDFYVFKLRNDQSVNFNRVVKHISKDKIITTNCYTRKDRLYHPSDMFLAGSAFLLKKYYSLPILEKTHLMTEMDNIRYFNEHPKENAITVCPEILLFKHYLNKNNWEIKNNSNDSYEALKNYFTILNSWDIDYRSKKTRTPLLPEGEIILPHYFKVRPFKNVPFENAKCYLSSDFKVKNLSVKDIYYLLLSKFLWFIWTENRNSIFYLLRRIIKGSAMDTDLEEYLNKIDFSSQYKRLVKKMKNKKVLFYGGGKLFKLINSKYELNKLNVVGVCDASYDVANEGESVDNFKKIPIECLDKYSFDIVLVATLEYRILIQKLKRTVFRHSAADIRPLAYLPFFVFLRELLSD